VSATPAQLAPNPATMAITDALGGQFEELAMADRVTYPQIACLGVGMRCNGAGAPWREQVNGNMQVVGNLNIGMGVPATSTTACVAGTVTWGTGFIYVCVATNTWQRAAIASW
jgi:hypothetical protein